MAPLVAARWRVASTLGEAIATWRNKPGLGGLDPSPRLKEVILTELATWAKGTFGDLERQIESEAAYVLHGVALAFSN